MAADEALEGFRIGDLVEICGLQGAKELNGKWGRVVALVKETSRLGVKLDAARPSAAETKSIKPGNLRKVELSQPSGNEESRREAPMPEAFMRTTPGTPVFKLLLRLLPAEALLALSCCQPSIRAEVEGADEAWEDVLQQVFGGDLATARRRYPGVEAPRAAFAALAATRRALGAVEIVRCDLREVARLGVEAAVVPANASLEPYGAASRAIFENAGPELLAHVESLERPVEVGTAVWTPGFGTGLQGLVHAVGPNLRTVDGDRKLHEVYAAAFEQLLAHGHESAAFGSISTGGNGFQAEAAAQIATEEIRAVLARLGPNRRLRIVIVAFELSVEDAFREALAKMRRRVNEDLLEVLPIAVLDPMLPGQRLSFSWGQLPTAIRPELDRFGMVGVRLTTGGPVPLPCGVEVHVRSRRPASSRPAADPGEQQLEVVALRRFRMPGSLQTVNATRDDRGRPHLQASVQWVPDEPDQARQGELAMSRSLEPLVEEWLRLVRDGRERMPGQMDTVLEDLGPMPPASELTRRALWVCALINPLPGLGVAYEIRPSALMASSASKRLEIAKQGLQDSIANLDGSRPLRT